MQRKQRQIYAVLSILLAAMLALVLVGFNAQFARADEPVIDEGDGPVQAAANDAAAISYSAADLEVGVYYMSDYPGTSSDLPNAANNGWGFYNTLRYHPLTFLGYPRWCQFSGHDCFLWSNSNAWEDDWVDNNNSWIDQVDYVFYEGHGNPNLFTLHSPDDEYVSHTEVHNQWGDIDLEWIFLLSCSVMADSHRADWFRSFNGLHGMAGFRTTAYDVPNFGSTLAYKLIFGYNIKDAWFKTCDQKQPSGVQAQIITEAYPFFFETIYNQQPDVVHDNQYWWWWKSCGAPTTQTVSPEQLGNSFPVYSTPALVLTESNKKWDDLNGSFEFTRTVESAALHEITLGDSRIITDAAGRELEMDVNTGQFYYIDHMRTFTSTAGVQAAQVLSPDDAKQVADDFLKRQGLMPGDAVFNAVEPVVLEQGQVQADRSVEMISQQTTGYQVIYNRYLTATVTPRSGADVVNVPIDGPGAKIKVYVDQNARTARVAGQSLQGAVTGAMGGWRPVANAGRSTATYPLLPYAQILKLFEQLEPQASYNQVPYNNPDSKSVVTYTVTGWEEQNGGHQDVIYPAYRLQAQYVGNFSSTPGVTETVVVTDFTWIAANPEFMRPLAGFSSQPAADARYQVGDTIHAEALDASKTLAALSYDSSLNFVMNQSPNALFTYSWRLGAVDGKEIGTGAILDYKVVLDDIGDIKGGSSPIVVFLIVTNTDSNHSSLNTASNSFTVAGIPQLYLPQVTR